MAALTEQHNKHLEELIEHHSDEIKKLEALKDEEMKVTFMFDLMVFFNIVVSGGDLVIVVVLLIAC